MNTSARTGGRGQRRERKLAWLARGPDAQLATQADLSEARALPKSLYQNTIGGTHGPWLVALQSEQAVPRQDLTYRCQDKMDVVRQVRSKAEGTAVDEFVLAICLFWWGGTIVEGISSPKYASPHK